MKIVLMVLLLFAPRLYRVFKKDEEKRSKTCRGIIYEDESLWRKIFKGNKKN